MPSVALHFRPPESEDIAELRIFEAPTSTEAFNLIETVLEVGSFPDYIDNWTTAFATSADWWFSIQWVDSKGAAGQLSEPVQGSADELFLGDVIARAKIRDPQASEALIVQEAEATVEMYFAKDPYTVTDADVPATRRYRILRGLANLTLARAYLMGNVTSSQADSWSAGIVSMNASSNTGVSGADIDELVKLANSDLNLSLSRVMLLKEITVAGGYRRVRGVDLSRAIIEI